MALSHRGLARLVETLPAGGAAQSYADKVLSYSPIAYWRLNDASGTTAAAEVGTDGTYSDTGMAGGDTGPDGGLSPTLDGTDDYVDFYSAALNTAFDPALGSALIWIKPDDWTQTAEPKFCLVIGVDGNNKIEVSHTGVANQIRFDYKAGGTVSQVVETLTAPSGWRCLALTWSSAGDAVKAYVSGAQVGLTQTGLGTWSGALASNRVLAGDQTTSPFRQWDGSVAHVAIWDSVLSDGDIADLATV